MVRFQAHRGVSTEYPENTLPAIEAALKQGYHVIELDVGVTKDLEFVLMHDQTINRTARTKDGRQLPESVMLSEITCEEAAGYDYGRWFSRKFEGTGLARFRDVLELVRKNCRTVKIDNKYQKFSEREKQAFFQLLVDYQDVACLTCSHMAALREAAAYFPDMILHYDGQVSEEILEELEAVMSGRELTVWMPYQNKRTSWVKVPFVTAEWAKRIRERFSLGIWLLTTYEELAQAEQLGADLVETNGSLKPVREQQIIADMHTHSECSHDSVCKLEDMCRSQIAKGTKLMALTDHFDTASYEAYDIHTPIRQGFLAVKECKERFRGQCEVLAGIEIGEGFWVQEEYEKVRKLCDYDVIIGSIHLVRYRNLRTAYAQIDFGKLSEEELHGYLEAYYEDMCTMLETMDIDILAHLTNPLRYMIGKYHLQIDISRYDEVIDRILRTIIQKGIALELNTSSFHLLGDGIPSREILCRYRELGGYLITLGSDAHVAENASVHFDRALEILREIGFHDLYYYRGREPIAYAIAPQPELGNKQ